MIRPRTEADLAALERALRAVHDSDGYPSVWPADPRGFLTPPAVGAWVAERRGEVVGQIVLRPVPDPPPEWVRATGLSPAEARIVSRLFVLPAARGGGVARALLRTAWAEARAQGKRAILDVHQRNQAAAHLYEAEGWRRIATVDGDWQDPGGAVPRVHVYLSPVP